MKFELKTIITEEFELETTDDQGVDDIMAQAYIKATEIAKKKNGIVWSVTNESKSIVSYNLTKKEHE